MCEQLFRQKFCQIWTMLPTYLENKFVHLTIEISSNLKQNSVLLRQNEQLLFSDFPMTDKNIHRQFFSRLVPLKIGEPALQIDISYRPTALQLCLNLLVLFNQFPLIPDKLYFGHVGLHGTFRPTCAAFHSCQSFLLLFLSVVLSSHSPQHLQHLFYLPVTVY